MCILIPGYMYDCKQYKSLKRYMPQLHSVKCNMEISFVIYLAWYATITATYQQNLPC